MIVKDIKAIDIHSHINHGTPYDSLGNDPLIYKAEYDFLDEMYKRANIEYVAYSTFAAVLHKEPVIEENEYLYNVVFEKDRAFQWVVVDPRQKETFAQADRMLESKKVLGIKLMPDMHGYDIKEYGDSIFSFANARKTVILIHPTGKSEDECSFADKYADTKLVLAHLSGEGHVCHIERAANGNIYADTSGCASWNNNIIEYSVSRVGSEHIIFGTDTYAAGFQRGRIEYAGISDKDKTNILRENAMRIFARNFG